MGIPHGQCLFPAEHDPDFPSVVGRGNIAAPRDHRRIGSDQHPKPIDAGSIFSILYAPPESVALTATRVKLSPWRNSTDEAKGLEPSSDSSMVPERDAGCGTAVATGA